MIRWLAAAAVTVGVNILLLLVMARLVEGGPARLETTTRAVIPVDLVRLRREPPPPPEPRHLPPPPPPPPEPPPPPRAPTTRAPRLATAPLPLPALELPLRLDETPYIGVFVPAAPPLETNLMPLVRIDPLYPRRALLAHIEGRVVVELTIGPDGGVADPRIVEAQPPGMFENAVLRAVRRWKFAPKVIDGEAVTRRALQTIRFSLGEGKR